MNTDNYSTSSRDADKFVVRLPDGFREQIAELAKASERSMNSEIVARLKHSITQEQKAEVQEKLINLLLEKIDHLEARLLEQEQPLEQVA